MRRGLPGHAFDGRPQIAIANTASDLTPCNSHLDEVAASVKQGVWEAGGVPLNLPVVSLGETQVRPTAMLWRNLAAMATEEMLRANPVDGVVLLGGCDKTIPSLLMAAASVDLPALVVPGGPMLTGHFRGAPLGCGTDVWRLGEEVRAGNLPAEVFHESESAMIRSRGHCNTMGTASTMACLAEALGMTIPGVAGIPAPDSRLLERAHHSGRLATELVAAGRRPSAVLTAGSFRNAIVALAAIGGSTNGVVHLLALAGRLGVELTLDDFDRIGSGVPLLVDLQPAGRHLMEDFHRAGGLLAVLAEVADLLDPEATCVTGRPLVEHRGRGRHRPGGHPAPGRAAARGGRDRRAARQPLPRRRGHQAGRGHPGAAAPPRPGGGVREHRGPARPPRRPRPGGGRGLGAGPAGLRPKGYPGMPEVGNMALPAKLLARGVRDMVRISDGRMSGTAYGTVVLHVAPEAAAGGPLALVRSGDPIVLDVLPAPSTSTSRPPSWPAGALGGRGRRLRRPRQRLAAPLHRPRPPGRPRRRPRLPGRHPRLRGHPRVPLTGRSALPGRPG